MEEYQGFETVKQKLIVAGIAEIEEHGITDFSLRRVATACNVSCAAPYKHFESKEDFIAEIVLYIHNKWRLLQEQVASVFANDPKKQLTEICVAYVKFWIANPNFRAVLMLKTDTFGDERIHAMAKITECIEALIRQCCAEYALTAAEEMQTVFCIRSLLYGATLMIDSGELKNDTDTINMLRRSIDAAFQK